MDKMPSVQTSRFFSDQQSPCKNLFLGIQSPYWDVEVEESPDDTGEEVYSIGELHVE